MEKLQINDLPIGFNKARYIENHLNKYNLGIEFHYNSKFENAKILRDFIDVIFTKIDINPIQISRIILLSDELNNNAIEYGSLKGDNNIMRVKVIKKDNKIKINIEVEDSWKWLKHLTASAMEDNKKKIIKEGFKNHKSIRWRWLFMIILKIVDNLYFKDSSNGGLVVWFDKELYI